MNVRDENATDADRIGFGFAQGMPSPDAAVYARLASQFCDSVLSCGVSDALQGVLCHVQQVFGACLCSWFFLQALALAASTTAQAETLKLERKIVLEDVAGRIDHMAFDPATNRLCIAELGNDSVDILDISTGVVLHRIRGRSEPQGVGYARAKDLLIVANGGTGEVMAYRGRDYVKQWSISLKKDADNVRIDRATGAIFVGF